MRTGCRLYTGLSTIKPRDIKSIVSSQLLCNYPFSETVVSMDAFSERRTAKYEQADTQKRVTVN
jgi:hypothetical protein